MVSLSVFRKTDNETTFYQPWNQNWITHKNIENYVWNTKLLWNMGNKKMSISHENQTPAYHKHVKESFQIFEKKKVYMGYHTGWFLVITGLDIRRGKDERQANLWWFKHDVMPWKCFMHYCPFVACHGKLAQFNTKWKHIFCKASISFVLHYFLSCDLIQLWKEPFY